VLGAIIQYAEPRLICQRAVFTELSALGLRPHAHREHRGLWRPGQTGCVYATLFIGCSRWGECRPARHSGFVGEIPDHGLAASGGRHGLRTAPLGVIYLGVYMAERCIGAPCSGKITNRNSNDIRRHDVIEWSAFPCRWP